MRFAAGAAALMAALAVVIVASAHAEPSRARPGDGAVLDAPPTEVVLVMTQDMVRRPGANAIDVFDGSGNEVTAEDAQVDANDRRRLSVALPPNLPPGEYLVRWRTLSADDGDAASGELRFRVDPGATPHPGREVLGESLLGGSPDVETGASPRLESGAGNGGTGWVLVAALGAIGLLLGIGAGVIVSRRGA
ncbi:copper resistance protein CopC [Tepidiforma sp.]|uniref:copper resistance CopC family protein n=1 Tax=Tepidiforma sp. TaxID=2682230 RepID=UPI002ADE503A|nr:copper resistance protein CopC [Tepidiforma sp.]